MKRIDYFWPSAFVKITGIVFISQLFLEISGVVVRKPGFEWVTGACGVAFCLSLLYASIVLLLNSREKIKRK